MISWILILAPVQSANPTVDFARISERIANLGAFRAQITSVRRVPHQPTFKMTADLQRDPAFRIRLDMQEPRTEKLDRTDSVYMLANSSLIGYDRLNQETFRRSAPGSLRDAATFRNAMKSLDGSVDALLNPESVRADLSALAQSSTLRWAKSSEGGLTVYRASDGKQTFRFAFEPKTYRLRQYVVASPAATFDWTYRYLAAPRAFTSTLAIPANAFRVDAFAPRAALCRFADAKTESLVRAAILAHRRFLKGRIETETGSLLIAYPNMAQVTKSATWTYRAGNLRLTRSGTLIFSQPMDRNEVLGRLTGASASVDGYLRSLLLGNAPMREFFSSDLTARIVGQMTVAGAPGTLISADSYSRRGTFVIRNANKLVGSVRMVITGTRGEALEESRRTFRYKPGPVTLP